VARRPTAEPPNATLGWADERGALCVACVDREQAEIGAERVFYLFFRPKTYPLDTRCAVCGLPLNNAAALAAADVVTRRLTA
jgi:hypothetical protein